MASRRRRGTRSSQVDRGLSRPLAAVTSSISGARAADGDGLEALRHPARCPGMAVGFTSLISSRGCSDFLAVFCKLDRAAGTRSGSRMHRRRGRRLGDPVEHLRRRSKSPTFGLLPQESVQRPQQRHAKPRLVRCLIESWSRSYPSSRASSIKAALVLARAAYSADASQASSPCATVLGQRRRP